MAARFSYPAGITVDPLTGHVMVVDGGNGTVRELVFAKYWRRITHRQAHWRLRLAVRVALQAQRRNLQSVGQPLWLPNELWCLVFGFLHDTDWMGGGAAAAGTMQLPPTQPQH